MEWEGETCSVLFPLDSRGFPAVDIHVQFLMMGMMGERVLGNEWLRERAD